MGKSCCVLGCTQRFREIDRLLVAPKCTLFVLEPYSEKGKDKGKCYSYSMGFILKIDHTKGEKKSKIFPLINMQTHD